MADKKNDVMKLSQYSFTRWLAGAQAVSFALLIGVVFLITNYQNILHITNPENKDFFNYPFWLRVLLSHIDSLFFGLATAIFIFQSKSERQKVLYCIFEAIMVGLNLNRNYMGEDALFWLSCYIAIFSGFTLYFLGTLAKQHNDAGKVAQTREAPESEQRTTTLLEKIEGLLLAQTGKTAQTYNGLVDSEGNPLSDKVVFAKHEEPAPIGFVLRGDKTGKIGRPSLPPEKVSEIQAYLQNGFSIRKTAEACKVSIYSVTEIKKQAKTL